MHSKRDRAIVGFTLFILLIVLPLYAFKVGQKVDYTDFSVYYKAAVRAKQALWGEIYNLKDGASPFRYAPPILPFLRPFSELTSSQAHLAWYFCQVIWFGLGFAALFKTIRLCMRRTALVKSSQTGSMSPLAITCLSFLFVLRFCLDCFTIGQSSSLLFLGFCFGLYSWVKGNYRWTTASLFIPTIFKIGPGFLYGVFLSTRKRYQSQALTGFALCAFSAALISLFAGWSVARELWVNWVQIVINDSVYYDASHYGSQSIKSCLLRAVNWGWISADTSGQIYVSVAIAICLGTLFFWALRKPRYFYGRALFFSLGLFPYFWLMPETFKYSFTPLAIPVALIFSAPRISQFGRFSLIFGALFLSITGKDIVGDLIFFGHQMYSFPLLASFLLAGSIFELAWSNSTARYFISEEDQEDQNLGPWPTLPTTERDLKVSVLVPIHPKDLDFSRELDTAILKINSKLHQRLAELHSLLQNLTENSFEILLISPKKFDLPHLSSVSWVQEPHQGDGKYGASLRTGFLASRGNCFLTLQTEQPCQNDFYKQALELLNSGHDLVRANRRMLDSHFRIQVKLLPLVYGRHRLGLAFNRVVRLFLPIQTSDTHSGTFAASWRLAQAAFAAQSSSGFLFDLELSLTAVARGYLEKDLPVSITLEHEKTVQRMAGESFSILFGLFKLAARYRKGCYGVLPAPQAITSDDWGLSAGVNQGILELAELGVVRRVSMMANSEHLSTGLKELQAVPGIELGIHFNLTYGRSVHLTQQRDRVKESKKDMNRSPMKFMLNWLNPLQKSEVIEAERDFVRRELVAQLDHFKRLGVSLRYLDGHHHIHLVPGLMDVIDDVLHENGITQVRLPLDFTLWKTNQAPIILLSLWARSRLKRLGFKSLPCIYPQQKHFLNPGDLRALLAKHPNHEVIVHPAKQNDLASLEFPDSYTEGRVLEYQALRMLKNL